MATGPGAVEDQTSHRCIGPEPIRSLSRIGANIGSERSGVGVEPTRRWATPAWPILKTTRKTPVCRTYSTRAPVDAPASGPPRTSFRGRVPLGWRPATNAPQPGLWPSADASDHLLTMNVRRGPTDAGFGSTRRLGVPRWSPVIAPFCRVVRPWCDFQCQGRVKGRRGCVFVGGTCSSHVAVLGDFEHREVGFMRSAAATSAPWRLGLCRCIRQVVVESSAARCDALLPWEQRDELLG